jgi:hypothetical protein
MKRFSLLVMLLVAFASAYSCPGCDAQQPKILRGITHGAGPQSKWDLLIVAIAAVIVIATLFFSVKWLLSPGEKSEKHIKRLVLNYE